MEKESLGDKIARKTMESAQAQKHWAMHERVFGPLLKEAFADSPAARLKLLTALNDDRDGAMAALKQLQRSSARSYGPVKKSVDKILLKKDPHFFVVPLKEKKIAEFWSWFGVYEDTLRQQLDERAYEAGIAPLLEQLRVTLPFWTEPDVTLGRNPVGYVLEMRDGYSASVEAGLRQLMAACPPEIRKLWTFVVEH